MKVLGLGASIRRGGNSEILVKAALMGAEAQGAQVEFLRLSAFRIQPCLGDLLCVFNDQPCHIKDDLNPLLERIYSSDGIILGVPCYALGTPAILKQILDRSLSIRRPAPTYGKPGAIVVTYGARGDHAYAWEHPDMLLHLALGMKVIAREMVNCQGSKDVLLDEAALERAQGMGRNVARAIETGDFSYQGDTGVCPLCHGRLLRILKDGRTAACPTCGIQGQLAMQDGRLVVEFPESEIQHSYIWAENWRQHLAYHLIPSKQFYLQTREPRREKRGLYDSYLKEAQMPEVQGRG
jgi:multimeric flavodoxin WrbA